MKSKQCDLHIHSNFSDSDSDIESIFQQAKKKKIGCIAITDHDTVEGLSLARIFSKIYDIELIEGVELSAQQEDAEVHILGYFIDSDSVELKLELSHVKELRMERLLWMVGKLNSLGVDVDEKELLSNVKGAVPTRLHLGLYLKEKGRVQSLKEAFQKYLSPGKPAYTSRIKYSVEGAINLIKKHRGISILAHPHAIANQFWVQDIIACGVDGVELVYPRMSSAKSSFYRNIVDKAGLLKSGGSDAHGSYKEFTGVGEVSIPYSWVEDMKKCLKMSII